MELIKEEQAVVKAIDFKPARGRILIRPHPRKERTESGFYLPPPKLGQKQDEQREFTGDVMRVGLPRYLSTGELGSVVAREGDTISFMTVMPWHDIAFHLEGEDAKENYFVLDQDDISGVFG